MNTLDYYTRQKAPWDSKEEEAVKREYEVDTMTISEIADIHRRTPGSIGYKLKNLGLVQHNTLARGYSEYRQSKLYREVVENGKKDDDAKAKRKEEKMLIKESDKEYTPRLRERELVTLRTEVEEIKKDVKEILRLMNAIYDFENQ